MILAQLDSDARAEIPAEVLEAFGLRPGDSVGFSFVNGRFILRPASTGEEMDQEIGVPLAELRALIEEGSTGSTVSATEAFAELRAHAATRRSPPE